MKKRMISIMLILVIMVLSVFPFLKVDASNTSNYSQNQNLNDEQIAAYQKYYELLLEHKTTIDMCSLMAEDGDPYQDAIYSDIHPVAICDVWGDDGIPELIYCEASVYREDNSPLQYAVDCIDINIVTYHEGKCESLYSDLWATYDWHDDFCVFQISGSDAIYRWSPIIGGEMYLEISAGADSSFEQTLVCVYDTYTAPDHYLTSGDNPKQGRDLTTQRVRNMDLYPISEEQYNDTVAGLKNHVTNVLLFSDSSYFDQFNAESIAMTCDEAIKYLGQMINETPAPSNQQDVKSDEQYDVNVFLSNFSEQNAFSNGFDVNDWNAEELVNFAFIYCKINRSWNGISDESINEEDYYTITLDSVNDILHRFFGITLQTTEIRSEFSQVPLRMPSDGRNKVYFMNDRFYFVAADGESYNRLSIVNQTELLESGNLRLHFDIYSLDIEEYLYYYEVGSDYYSLTSEQAAQNKQLTKEQSGVAVVRPCEYNGRQTYQLISYYTGIQFDNSSTYVNFKWDPNILFSKDPTGYDKDLAIAGLTLSAAVYHGFDSIDSIFESLGYSADPHWNLYYDQMDVNWPGHSIYSRPINVNGESKMLITLVIEGTRNIFSQDGLTDVIGGVTSFGLPADNVKSSLDAYVKKYYNDFASNDIIYFITGHSLGGATAGRVAKKLLDAGAPKNNVFCYPIAPPHNTVSILGEECKNIHNIINQCDQVTHMGISQTVGELHVLNYEKYKKDIGDTYKELFDTTIPDNWLGMHECKTYLALLCAVPEGEIEYMLEPSEPGCRVVIILCPVNVDVYNSVGQLVGYNQVNESRQIQGVFLAIVNGDQKYIYLPYDDEFSLRLTGTDDGTMDYIVQNMAYDGTILESIEYSDVQLTKGKIMTTKIGGAIDTSDIELYVVDENGKAIAEVQKDGTEKSLASDNAEKPQKEIRDIIVKQNTDFIPLVVGIGAIILIGLTVLFLWKRQNRNKNRQ